MKKQTINLIVISILVSSIGALFTQQTYAHASDITSQKTYKTTPQTISNLYKKAYQSVQNDDIDKLKRRFKLNAIHYSSAEDYLKKVTNFFDNYDPNLGLLQFLEEIIVQQTLDKIENPGDIGKISSAWQAYLMYDSGFDRNGKIFQMMGPEPLPDPENTQKRLIKVTEESTGEEISLNAFYLNQNSDTTIIATGGFRGNGWDINSPEVQLLKSFGYNVLLTESRSSGASEGKYISLGYYEKNDYTNWINNEVSIHLGQKVYLYGGSMGGAVVMGALNNALPTNVKGLIEIAGFSSIDQELTYLYDRISIDLGNIFDWVLDFNPTQREATYKVLNEDLLIPKVKMSMYSSLPLEGVKTSTLPKLFIHGSADNIIPYSNATLLYNSSAGSHNRIALIPGATHGGDIFVGEMGLKTKEAMDKFFND